MDTDGALSSLKIYTTCIHPIKLNSNKSLGTKARSKKGWNFGELFYLLWFWEKQWSSIYLYIAAKFQLTGPISHGTVQRLVSQSIFF